MRRVLVALVLLTSLACTKANTGSKDCSPVLRPEVDAKVAPVLLAFSAGVARNDWFDKDFEDRLDAVLTAKDPVSREAQVALLNYYLGEHAGEDLTCTVSQQGSAALPMIRRYSTCRPRSSAEPLPGLRADAELPKIAAQLIASGKPCERAE